MFSGWLCVCWSWQCVCFYFWHWRLVLFANHYLPLVIRSSNYTSLSGLSHNRGLLCLGHRFHVGSPPLLAVGVQAEEERGDMEKVKLDNKRILFNLLPAHVAQHFLMSNPRNMVSNRRRVRAGWTTERRRLWKTPKVCRDDPLLAPGVHYSHFN